MIPRVFHLCAFLFALGVALPVAQAQIFQEQPLDFGRWIVRNNNSNHTITVQPDNSYSASLALIELGGPRPGIYRVEGLVPFTACGSVDVYMMQPMRRPSAPTFTVDSFNTNCTPSDVNGIAWVTVGARAVTSGAGPAYAEGAYQGELSLIVNF